MSSIFHGPQKSIFRRSLLQQCPYYTIRTLHASTPNRDLVAPPDPISHMRPMLYEPPSQRPAPRLRHPYSLSEFKTGSSDDIYDYELQYKLLRQQLDALHQSFWFDSNRRFYAGKETVLNSLPPTATARDKEEAISVFLTQWLGQEQENADDYTTKWRRRNFQLLKLGTRVELHKIGKQITNYFKRWEF